MFYTVERFRNQLQIAMGYVDVHTASSGSDARQRAWWEVIIQIIVSLSVGGAGLFVILSGNRFDGKVREWAFGSVGTVVGYWMR